MTEYVIFDPNALTKYQYFLLQTYPATSDAFRFFAGPIDRADAVDAGAVNDPVLLELFEKLGPACANVDEASAVIRNAAGRVESEAITIRNKNEPDGGRWAESSGDSARATT